GVHCGLAVCCYLAVAVMGDGSAADGGAALGFSPSTGLVMAPGNGVCATHAANPISRNIFCRCNSRSTISCYRPAYLLRSVESITQSPPSRCRSGCHKNGHLHTPRRQYYRASNEYRNETFAPK